MHLCHQEDIGIRVRGPHDGFPSSCVQGLKKAFPAVLREEVGVLFLLGARDVDGEVLDFEMVDELAHQAQHEPRHVGASRDP